MPQMSPLAWMNLFIIFTTTFMIINSLNYFSFIYKTPKKLKTNEKKNLNWKW